MSCKVTEILVVNKMFSLGRVPLATMQSCIAAHSVIPLFAVDDKDFADSSNIGDACRLPVCIPHPRHQNNTDLSIY